MARGAHKLQWSAVVASGVLAVAGGAFFGLFSCGGYVWHSQLYWSGFGVAIVASAVFAPPALSSVGARVLLLLFLPLLHWFALAGAAPFHPATPTSMPGYWKAFWYALENGPC